MSNLFDDLFPEDATPFDANEFESMAQRDLRVEFDSLTHRNIQQIENFDPLTPLSFCRLNVLTGETRLENEEPQLTEILMARMLKDCGLDIPTKKDDPRLIAERIYSHGMRAIIFERARDTGAAVPVYCETKLDGHTPEHLGLFSVDMVQEIITQYEDLDEQRAQLIRRIGIEGRALSKLRLEELKELNETLDTIEGL